MWAKRKVGSPAKVESVGMMSSLRASAARLAGTWALSGSGLNSSTAPWKNVWPITAPRSITACSGGRRRSRRASRRAEIVGGSLSSPRSAVALHRPPASRARSPAGQGLQESAGRPERLGDGEAGLGKADGAGQADDHVLHVRALVAHHSAELDAGLLQRIVVRDPRGLPGHLRERPERDAVPVG